jgi:general secretion pathway protein D
MSVRPSAVTLALTAALAGCTTPPPRRPASPDLRPGMPAFTGNTPVLLPAPGESAPGVAGTILPGTPQAPVSAGSPRPSTPAAGDVSLNFPAVDPRVLAQAVLGDILHLHYQVAPGAAAPVTLVTARPVARRAVIGLLEDALRQSNLALSLVDGVYIIQPVDQARAAVPAGAAENAVGFATETIRLQFVSADEMKRLLDPLLPGVVTGTDPQANTLVVAGTSGQRANVRELLRQFDVNWLRNMSFGLFVPQHTDTRLIVPELDKLLNGDGAPTKGLVRLIAMDRLNGILAISAQRQYLEDVRRWVEVLDREGQSNERRLYVYRVQNGRSRDLVKVLNAAFGRVDASTGATDLTAGTQADSDLSTPPRTTPSGATSVLGGGSATPPPPPPGFNGPGGGGGPASAGAPATEIKATISSDDTNNSIIVFGTGHDYAIIADALRQLDVLPAQVLIEAAITEVTLNDDLRYGVQWSFSDGNSNAALGEGTTNVPLRIFPGFSYFYGGNSISATLNALEGRTKVNVISAPKLMVLNNQTAALQVGDEVPVATASATNVVTSNSAIVNSIEYRDTGVILKITPRVNSGGLVLLDISQEVSAVSAATTTTTATNNSPTISTRRISTSVAVQDGQVLALGGLIRDSRTKGKTGIPGLVRIPVVGALFGRQEDIDDRTELLVLIKPHVVRTAEDASAVTDELRAKIKTVTPIRPNSPLP